MRAALLLALLPMPAAAEEVVVFAAASLQTALDGLAAAWEAETGHDVVLSYAGTSQLARQVEAGAPAQVFVSASADWMDALEDGGLIDPASRTDLLGNTLVLVAHGADVAPVALGPDTDLPALLGGGRLAMALVDSVPAGQYGREALASLGLWDEAEPLVAQAENVRAALALVASGEAPYGIVYASDAAAEPGVTVVAAFPEGSHAPVVYSAALVAANATDAARAFLAHLDAPEADAAFAAEGFEVLD
jgi:molybdate transport system substrate-binding protein